METCWSRNSKFCLCCLVALLVKSKIFAVYTTWGDTDASFHEREAKILERDGALLCFPRLCINFLMCASHSQSHTSKLPHLFVNNNSNCLQDLAFSTFWELLPSSISFKGLNFTKFSSKTAHQSHWCLRRHSQSTYIYDIGNTCIIW